MAAPMWTLFQKNSAIFLYFFTLYIVTSQSESNSIDGEEHLLCRHCGHPVAYKQDFIQVPSALSQRNRNDTILGQQGVLIQLFKNPHGAQFELITASAADVTVVDKAHNADSWFPGYMWQISICPKCGFHLGWTFHHKINEGLERFVGLILDSVIQNSYVDNLLAVPKSYRS